MFGTKLEGIAKLETPLIFSNIMAALALLCGEDFGILFKRRDSPTGTAEMGFPNATAHYKRADHVRDPF
jgi:hypothetical protein